MIAHLTTAVIFPTLVMGESSVYINAGKTVVAQRKHIL